MKKLMITIHFRHLIQMLMLLDLPSNLPLQNQIIQTFYFSSMDILKPHQLVDIYFQLIILS